jgi:hypothetical protein
MMRCVPLRAAGVALLLAIPLRAGSLESAFRARELIGPDVPTRLVRIENRATGPSRYPAEFHGLVISFADIVWLYTEFDGTQNLSFRRGQVAEDQANLGALLQTVEPGLQVFHDEASATPAQPLPSAPPNGCFVACLARWRELLQSASPPRAARLIACFPPDRPSGHMLLEFRRGRHRYVFDPDLPDRLQRLSREVGDTPLAVASAALHDRWGVAPVRATPVELPTPLVPPARKMIAADSRSAPPQT